MLTNLIFPSTLIAASCPLPLSLWYLTDFSVLAWSLEKGIPVVPHEAIPAGNWFLAVSMPSLPWLSKGLRLTWKHNLPGGLWDFFLIIFFLVFCAQSSWLWWTGANLAALKSHSSDKHLLDVCVWPPAPQPFFSPHYSCSRCASDPALLVAWGATWYLETRSSLLLALAEEGDLAQLAVAWLMKKMWDGSSCALGRLIVFRGDW